MIEYIKNSNVFALIEKHASTSKAAERALSLVPLFYAFILYWGVSVFFSGRLSENPESNFMPPLPIFWASHVPFEYLPWIIGGILLVSSLVAAFLARFRAARIVGFVGILQYHAFISAFGTRDHGWIVITAIAFFLVFLPDIRKAAEPSLSAKKRTLLVFWAAAASVFLIYALAGVGKLVGAIDQAGLGAATIFSLKAAPLHVADWAFHADRIGLFGPYIINHPFVGLLGGLGIFFVQILSSIVLFFPRFYKAWAFLLVMTHVGIFLAMGIPFVESVFPTLLFLAYSPLLLLI